MDNPMLTFEKIKRTNDFGYEYWSARELAKTLEYLSFRNFIPVIERAKEACRKSGQNTMDHFADVRDMIEIGKTASREIADVHLSRYACYLILQNADPSKEIIALGQTYFAIQTRKQEVQNILVEDKKRVDLREEVTIHNKHLAESAGKAGVENYGLFTNYGYMGLYGGLDMKKLHAKKKLEKSQKVLDHMNSEELAANLFRATQTDAKLRRENIQGEAKANQAHFEVGRKVRQTIKDLGGTMPENLPASESIGKAKSRLKRAGNLLK